MLFKRNDEAKAAHVYRGLNDAIKDGLAQVGQPAKLKDLEEAATRMDIQLFELPLTPFLQACTNQPFGVRSLLGFCNFYQPLIKTCSSIVTPLTHLTKKDQPYT